VTLPTADGPGDPSAVSDSLERVAAILDGLDTQALEQHPQAFTAIDELLRAALEEPANSVPAAGAG
jgi:hypothetical protein